MRLDNLISDISVKSIEGSTALEIQTLTSDSRKVDSNSVFIAISGTSRDGHTYLNEVISKGCKVLVVENRTLVPKDFVGTILTVNCTREFLDLAVSKFHGDPSKKIICIGVTGTNGKTTITHLIEAVLNDQSLPTAVMGTIDHHFQMTKYESELTTPGPELLQYRLAEFKAAGAQALAMEVSSHALDQHRADSVHFDLAVFTNLTRDHLDYHTNMEEYFYAKQKLFDDLLWKSCKFDRFAIINGDDYYGRRIKVASGVKKLYYGFKDADLQIRLRNQNFDCTEFSIDHLSKRYIIKTPLIGSHNAYNLTAAFGVAVALKLDLKTCVQTLEKYPGVAGRLERVMNTKNIHVFVDYAHTDDALKNVLESLKQIRDTSSVNSKIITVFGCGGDRDKGKRPIMAATSEKYSDLVIVTSDNPRTEDPNKIIDDIVPGFSSVYYHQSVLREVEREKGIALALKQANDGDVVLIAGKGHEDYQIIGKEKIHFSDVEVVKKLLK